MLKELSTKISTDQLTLQSAALAFYTALSFAPVVVILITLLSRLKFATQEELTTQVGHLFGNETKLVFETVLRGAEASSPDLGSFAGWGSLLVLFISASVVFGQLKETLNLIFGKRSRRAPAKNMLGTMGRAMVGRLLSMGVVLIFILAALASVILSSALIGVLRSTGLSTTLNETVSVVLFTVIFSCLFRFLPQNAPPWRASFIGGFLSGVFFSIGKFLIGLYLGRAALGSPYGAAGSLLAFLVWVYYSSLIVFIGAEVTATLAKKSRALYTLSSSEPRR